MYSALSKTYAIFENMDGIKVACAIVILLVLAWYFGIIQLQAPNVNVAAAPAPPSAADTSASIQTQGKYGHLIELLKGTPKWLYFDEKAKSRKSITFQVQPDGKTLVMTADVAEKPATFNYGPANGNGDTMVLTDPSKGGEDKYATYVMFVNERQLILEEKTDGKITFQQKLSV